MNYRYRSTNILRDEESTVPNDLSIYAFSSKLRENTELLYCLNNRRERSETVQQDRQQLSFVRVKFWSQYSSV